jgi:hypothetical protein
VIPRQEGEVTIPAISVSMFNPKTAKYYSKSTKPIAVKIIPGDKSGSLASNRINDKSSPSPKKNELPNIITSQEIGSSASASSMNLGIGILFFVVLSGLLVQARREFGWGQKRRSLSLRVAKRLKKVDELVQKGDWKETGVQLTNVFYFTLGEISGQGGANIEMRKLLDLMPPSVRRELGTQVSSAIEKSQILGFAPEGVVGSLKEKENLKKFFEESKKLLEQAIALADQPFKR